MVEFTFKLTISLSKPDEKLSIGYLQTIDCALCRISSHRCNGAICLDSVRLTCLQLSYCFLKVKVNSPILGKQLLLQLWSYLWTCPIYGYFKFKEGKLESTTARSMHIPGTFCKNKALHTLLRNISIMIHSINDIYFKSFLYLNDTIWVTKLRIKIIQTPKYVTHPQFKMSSTRLSLLCRIHNSRYTHRFSASTIQDAVCLQCIHTSRYCKTI